MFSHRNHRLLLLCFFSAVSILSAQLLPTIQKDFYIDSSSASSTESGEITTPFKTLSSALTQAQSFVSEITESSPTQPLSINFYIKEDTTFLEGTSSTFSFDGTDRSPSSIKIAAYGNQGSLDVISGPPTLHFESSVHIALTVSKAKLIVENIDFEFMRETSLDKPEFILIEGKDSEITFNHCSFKNSKVNLQNADAAVIRLKDGKYLFKNCEFSQLELNNPLIVHEGSESSLLKCELNQFKTITMKESSLVRVTSALSFDLVNSKVEFTSGRLFEVTNVSSSILSDNTFTDAIGQFPLNFNSIQKVIAAKNTVVFIPQDHANHEGFLSITNFNMLGVLDTSITGYYGLSSAISAKIEDSYRASTTPTIMLQSINFNKNALSVYDTQGLALVNLDLKQRAIISVDNAVFSENTIYDKRANPTVRSEGASTLWIDAVESSLKIKRSTVSSNKADRALSNLYVSVGDLEVLHSVFKANAQLESPESSANYNSGIVFNNFGWFGEDLTFTEDTFQDNYNDYGGAISIREAEGLRIPHSVTIEKSIFRGNKAKEGGAIFTDVTSPELEYIQLNQNRFEGNVADIDPDFSASPKIATEERPHLFMQVLSQSGQNDYKSGEFALSNVVSGEDTGYSMEFYIANHKGERLTSNKQYYSTIYITSSHTGEAYLVKNFTNELTGPTVEISSFSVVAPFDSLNLIKLVMKNKDDPNEEYTFEFKVGIVAASEEPRESGRSRECEAGEIYSEGQQACVKCPPGTFSLTQDALACQACVKGADCSEGGNKIKALPGFWRDIAESEDFVVYACVDKERCLGGAENQCAEGYAGPLCEACNTKDTGKGIYRPFLRDTCKSCESKDPLEIVADIIGLAAPIVILLYTVRTIISKKGAVKQFSWCLYGNLFFSYMQNLFILGVLDYLPLPYVLSCIVNIIANPSFPLFGYLTCYFPSLITSSEAYVGIISLFASVPLMKMLLVILTAKFVARRGNVRKSILLGLIWLAVLEAPGFLDFCLRLFDCKQVGNWVYSPFFLDLDCDAQNFEFLRTIALVPIVLLITVICPLAITYSLTRGSLRSDEVESQKNLRVMVLAKSGDHIIKSHRSWIYFYIASFGKLGLLLLSASETSRVLTFSAVVLYFSAMLLLNLDRKIVPFKGWRTSLLFVDMLMLLISSVLGFALSFLNEGTVRTGLLVALWAGNAAYLFSVNVLDTKQVDGKAYGKLEEENVSSSDEKTEEKKRNSEQLDETM